MPDAFEMRNVIGKPWDQKDFDKQRARKERREGYQEGLGDEDGALDLAAGRDRGGRAIPIDKLIG